MRPQPRATTIPSAKSGRSPRRRIALAALAILIIPVLLIAVQGYRVLEAIGEAQGVAVVPLPTRATGEDGAGRRGPAARPPTGAALEPTPTSQAGTHAPGDDGTAGPAGTAIAPGATDAGPAPTPASATAADADEGAVIAASTVSNRTDVAADDVSAFEVLQALTTAGTGGGDPAEDAVWGGRDAVTILVIGVDRRDDGGDQNADVIIVARLDLRTQSVRAVGLPRDLLVEIPGYGPGKINGAYDLGVRANPGDPVAGVALLRDTVEDNFGVVIDHYVLVDFAGFEWVIDAVGGVEVTVPERIVDEAYPTDDYGAEVVVFEAGPQRMDGERALQYARTRNADSDDQRRQRQFQLLLALFEEGRSLGTLAQAADVVVALGGAVQTSFPLDGQLSLARIALDMDRIDVHLTGVEQPLVQEGWTDGGAWVYVGDPAAIAAFVHAGLGLPVPAA